MSPAAGFRWPAGLLKAVSESEAQASLGGAMQFFRKLTNKKSRQ